MPRGAGVDLTVVMVRSPHRNRLQRGVRKGDGEPDGKHDSARIVLGGSPC